MRHANPVLLEEPWTAELLVGRNVEKAQKGHRRSLRNNIPLEGSETNLRTAVQGQRHVVRACLKDAEAHKH